MNGILIIDKPAGITSHDVVSRVRRILRTKRVGHTGTLDPFATGVMVVLVGRATRLAQFLDKDEKEYETVMRFGFETDTGDLTGKRRETEGTMQATGKVDIERTLSQFLGEIEQVPPMYSAKKIDGKKLYELAREGKTVERKAVTVEISKLETYALEQLTEPEIETWDVGLSVRCSAGTYIRTLAEDIARAAGSLAHLTELRRTAAGSFSLGDAITLDELAEIAEPAASLIPMERAVEHLSEFRLREDRIDKTRNGMSTRTYNVEFPENEAIRMMSESGELVAVGYYNPAEKVVQPKVVL